MEITSLETLKQMKKTEIIELPAFDNGIPFVVEVKKPNLMNLIAGGKIPNPLLSSAMTLFSSGVAGAANEAMKDAKMLKDLAGLMEVLAEHTLVTPSYQDLKDNDIELTEDQFVDIMNYMQGGVKALTSFRNKQKRTKDNKSSK